MPKHRSTMIARLSSAGPWRLVIFALNVVLLRAMCGVSGPPLAAHRLCVRAAKRWRAATARTR
jgi:hypothetical protein